MTASLSPRRPLSAVVPAILALLVCASLRAAPAEPDAYWSFDGDLSDRGPSGSDAFAANPQFEDGHDGRALTCRNVPVTVPDAPVLRLAPGLQLDCWVRVDAIGPSWQPILIKEREYQLRIDPPSEGGQFSFFAHLDGWEPRVRSAVVPKPGTWYHLEAGWDGESISIRVDGDETVEPRKGTPIPTSEPLLAGEFTGALDEVRIRNPNALESSMAHWPFDGHTRDTSGRGHDLAGAGAELAFAPARAGQALRVAPLGLSTPDHPDLQLAAGFRLDCSVVFEALPEDLCNLVVKDGEYQLRINPPAEGGGIAFFVNLGGWEPRVNAPGRIRPGVPYRITAGWTGAELYLDVNGKRTRVPRSGVPAPGTAPLTVRPFPGLMDDLRIENPRLPLVQLRQFTQENSILRAGRRETISATLRNVGEAARGVIVELQLSPGIRCLDTPAREVGDLPMGGETRVRWTIAADTAAVGMARFRIEGADLPPTEARQTVAFFAEDDAEPEWRDRSPETPGRAFHIDSMNGDNANSGLTPDSPWKDFTPINGKTLGPGERLLLKRGSVFADELSLSAAGTRENPAEIGTYGAGPRPIIRRNWDIDDRCVLIRNPEFLRIRSLVVSHAAKGLVVRYTEGGHSGLMIEDCIAHHIEGLYRPNSHGIPEWRDRNGSPGDGLSASAGIAVLGAQAQDILIRDCEMFQTSWGFFVQGDDVTIDRVYCHDNYAHNTSPHPALVTVRRSYLTNSIFDASGWHASAGTMGIMLVNPQGLIIRNCTFRNQPDSGSHDEGGIDFENTGSGCLIDGCTFENNAGAAIEMLGLKAPQTRNVEIADSHFIRNNAAAKLGPAEIYVWGRTPDPEVCCSSGLIRDNGYVLRPGVEFFVNEAPQTTSWQLSNNREFTTPEELRRAMPRNRPPRVEAGPPIHADQTTVPLAGLVEDDDLPAAGGLKVRWEAVEGPGAVRFLEPDNPRTPADFAAPGDYLLRLVADDGELWLSDTVAVHILSPGTAVQAAWDFDTPLDKEGWTEVNPGTRVQHWEHENWPCTSHPVKLVAGGYFLLAIEDSADAHLLSPDTLGIPLAGDEEIVLRLQNHTPAGRMRIRFTTEASPEWDDAKTVAFPVTPNDDGPRTYTIRMANAPGWQGTLQQLRIDFATGEPLTGTCRTDFIRLSRSRKP